ncbi:MAG: 50S ribosomal protein L29 [Spirochaetes bacterium GWF1_31_7]|nr:MAG: 50S ribosomal protein L29 [Spirochaetes bacterium GWE1_32_154]OHD47312.1 MAG: 50S ribosomal protein L29 [Spirochaetes bacterium GWE2_31_10]OHD47372.1 MAG: 50S ribosomal protein L29 [Spirochaetes bacterium GWF1_31_7]OHD77891.1 MAG: 50S ribosomal protein L29 [Spirochaetes bacterium RIFOXYB1_FULL_32_8]HBD92826.1 50S ribosomal protein L29 [Spirochaetia bacterium]
MIANELREKSDKELMVEKDKLIKELHDLRFKKIIGVVENPVRMRFIRKDIARINTILQEKKIAEVKAKL